MRVPLLLVTASVLAGCYNYQPLATPTPAVGDEVQVALNADGTERVTRVFGPHITQLEARVLAIQADTLTLAVRVARAPGGIEFYSTGDTLALPGSSVASVSRRKLAVAQSLILGGLVVGGSIGAASAMHGSASGAGVSTVGGSNQGQ